MEHLEAAEVVDDLLVDEMVVEEMDHEMEVETEIEMVTEMVNLIEMIQMIMTKIVKKIKIEMMLDDELHNEVRHFKQIKFYGQMNESLKNLMLCISIYMVQIEVMNNASSTCLEMKKLLPSPLLVNFHENLFMQARKLPLPSMVQEMMR